jgi:hypothetical protein
MGLFYLHCVGRHPPHYVVLTALGREASSQFVVLPILGREAYFAVGGFTCPLVRGILCIGLFYLHWVGRHPLHYVVFTCTGVGGFLCMGLFYLHCVGRHPPHYVVLTALGREASSQFVVLPLLGWFVVLPLLGRFVVLPLLGRKAYFAVDGFTCPLVRGILCIGLFYLYWVW